jgi:hypothetical protein
MKYCDKIIMTRKYTSQRIIHESSFVASVVDSFDRTYKEDQLLKNKLHQHNNQNPQQNQRRQQQQPRSSPSKNNNNKNGTNTTASNNNNKYIDDNDDDEQHFLELPRTKLLVTGNALVKLHCLSKTKCMKTIEYCDQVIQKKRMDKKSRPIENEMAYLSSIIDAFLQDDDDDDGGNDNENENGNNGDGDTTATNSNNNNASNNNNNSTTVQLPQTKMKVIGNALRKLRALPVQEQERAILFCDRVVLKRDKKSRPIINETGYLASLMDNYVETQMNNSNSNNNNNGNGNGGEAHPTTTTKSPKQQQQQETTTSTATTNGNSVSLTPASSTLNTILNGASSSTQKPPTNYSDKDENSSSSLELQQLQLLITSLKRDLQAATTDLQDKEDRLKDLTKRLKEADTKWKTKLEDATTASKQDLTNRDGTILQLQQSLAETNVALQTVQAADTAQREKMQATLDSKDVELASSKAQRTKLQMEAEAMNRTFASMTKALVTTQEEKQEAIKRLEDCQAELVQHQQEELQKTTTLRLKQQQDAATLQALREELSNTKTMLVNERRKVDELLEASDMVATKTKRNSDSSEKASLLGFVIGQAAAAAAATTSDTLSNSGSDHNNKMKSNSNHSQRMVVAADHHHDTPFDFSQIFPENHPMPAPAPHIHFPESDHNHNNTLNSSINNLNSSITSINHNANLNIKNNRNNNSSDEKKNNVNHDSSHSSPFLDTTVKQELDFLAASYGRDALCFDNKNCITRTLYLDCDRNNESVEVHLVVTIPTNAERDTCALQVEAGISPNATTICSKEAQTVVVAALKGLVDTCRREANKSVGEENVFFTILQTADQWVQIEWASIQAKRLPLD